MTRRKRTAQIKGKIADSRDADDAPSSKKLGKGKTATTKVAKDTKTVDVAPKEKRKNTK
jgi:hypothetical protein